MLFVGIRRSQGDIIIMMSPCERRTCAYAAYT